MAIWCMSPTAYVVSGPKVSTNYNKLLTISETAPLPEALNYVGISPEFTADCQEFRAVLSGATSARWLQMYCNLSPIVFTNVGQCLVMFQVTPHAFSMWGDLKHHEALTAHCQEFGWVVSCGISPPGLQIYWGNIVGANIKQIHHKVSNYPSCIQHEGWLGTLWGTRQCFWVAFWSALQYHNCSH